MVQIERKRALTPGKSDSSVDIASQLLYNKCMDGTLSYILGQLGANVLAARGTITDRNPAAGRLDEVLDTDLPEAQALLRAVRQVAEQIGDKVLLDKL